MKTLLNLILTILLITAVAGCREPEKKYRIGVSQCSAESWRWKTNDEIMREKLFHDDVDVEIRSADDQNEKQIADIHYFIDNGFDLLIVNPNQESAITPAIREAQRKGIPVITFDRRIDSDDYTVHMEVDNYLIGKSVAGYALHLLPSSSVEVIEIQGDSTMSPTKKRHAGFYDEMTKHPRMKIVASVYADWNPDIAARKTDSLLALYPNTKLIYAHSDIMAIGAANAARSRGADGIHFLGIDGNAQVGIKAVADSVLDATFLYPTYGADLLRTALAILKGEKVDRDVQIQPLPAVDKSNAEILLKQDALLKDETDKILILKDKLEDSVFRQSTQSTMLKATVAIVVLLFFIIFLMLRAYWQHRRHQRVLTEQNRLLQEERDKQKILYRQLEDATHSKLVFFTNVSHDLRTPLTLIAEPVEQLYKSDNLSPEKRHSLLKIANRNVKILKRLIDQILDFRKYENGKMTANLEEVKFYRVIGEWLESFDAVLRKKDIKFKADIPDDPDFSIAIDPEKIERVLFNIMSNAIKYTPANGRISIECHNTDTHLVFSVTDSGEGISQSDLQRIFERFYQADRVHPGGSGIGLSLAKAFVELHGGTIEASSEKGKGSCFTVSIPIAHVGAAAEVAADSFGPDDAVADELDEESIESMAAAHDKPLMLVVDDNKDIQKMIVELMEDDYVVICASNGRQGVRLASRYTPDIIVSDVMMPLMDGMEFCRIIKAEVSTSHIPVLMLTACTMDSQRLEGYESGADGYLSKPFSSEMLKTRCRNLLDNRRRIKDVFGTGAIKAADDKRKPVPASTAKDGPAANMESEFYDRFISVVSDSLGNPDLTVEDIADKMGLGKSQLSRKIKALTNYAPVEIIRTLRLKRARKLLAGTDRSIGEIAFEVGFSNQAYFSKCFKDEFNESPSDLRNRLSKDTK